MGVRGVGATATLDLSLLLISVWLFLFVFPSPLPFFCFSLHTAVLIVYGHTPYIPPRYTWLSSNQLFYRYTEGGPSGPDLEREWFIRPHQEIGRAAQY